jgi:hypothetical protein
MPQRVIPEPVGPPPDPLTLGEKKTWAAYLPVALIDALKRGAREDGFPSASAYAEALLVFALRRREAERVADRSRR